MDQDSWEDVIENMIEIAESELEETENVMLSRPTETGSRLVVVYRCNGCGRLFSAGGAGRFALESPNCKICGSWNVERV